MNATNGNDTGRIAIPNFGVPLGLCILLLTGYHSGMLILGEARADGSSLWGRIALGLMMGTTVLYALPLARFHLGRLCSIDYCFAGYVILAIIGMEAYTEELFGPLFRIFFFFYVLPFLVYRTRPRTFYISGLLVVLFVCLLFQCWAVFSHGDVLSRRSFGGVGTVLARNALAFLLFSYIVYMLLSRRQKLVIFPVFAGIFFMASFLLFVSAARQAFLGVAIFGLCLMVAESRRFLGLAICGISLVGIVVAAGIGEYAGIDFSRLLDYSMDTIEKRLFIYTIYSGFLIENFVSHIFFSIFSAFDTRGAFIYEGVWMGHAPHNIYLSNVVFYSFSSAMALLGMHMGIFTRIYRLWRELPGAGAWASDLYVHCVSLIIVLYLVGMISNYLFGVSSFASYVFYFLLGMFVIKYRSSRQ